MKKLAAALVLMLIFTSMGSSQEKNRVELIRKNKKIDILVDGNLFTSYIYTDSLTVLKKPVLFPLISANGVVVTRGFPIQPRGGERTDHPHHIGAWFNYGDVNGLDFWNNSDAISPENSSFMGTIKHEKIIDAKSGIGKATLLVTSKWVNSKNKILLNEETEFIFYAEEGKRIIERTTTLTAQNENVLFKDNKEGMLGIRMARELELPSDKPVELSDAHGNITKVPVMDNNGVTGNYFNSNGVLGADVWGKRAKWTALSGTIKGKDVTVVIFDYPKNIGYPTYWHARDYGLFAANPLGQSIFSDGKETLNYKLDADKSVTFKYCILIFDGKASIEQIEGEYSNFVSVR